MQKYTAPPGDIIKIFWSHTARYKKLLVVAVLLIVGSNVVNLVVPWFYRRFFNVLAAGTPSMDAFVVLKQTLFIILSLYLAENILRRLADFSNVYLQSRVMTELMQNAEAYMLQHSHHFFINSFAGSLVRRVNRLARSYEQISDRIQFNILPLAITVLVALVALTLRHPWLGGLLAVWTVLFMSISYAIARWKQPYDLNRAEEDSTTTGVLADIIANSSNVQLFSTYDSESANYATASERLDRTRRFTWNINVGIDAIQGFLMMAVEIIIMFVAIRLWRDGQLTVGDFALIQSYLLMIMLRIWDFGQTIRKVYESLADASEMVGILNEPHGVEDVLTAKPLVLQHGGIVFSDVNFSFHRTRPVLRRFNLDIKPGEHVALVGPSGAGKSTITKLLFRLYDVGHGRITIDGQNIAEVTQASLRQALAIVPQDPVLFHRSLLDNIRYGNPTATREEVVRAAEQAHCHEFIADLPEQYETFVGERGVKLSGGERQRVAIARAILKDAPILVLDEATSSLDSESESLIQDALKTLMRGRTSIVIAHRLSTIMQMDRIVVIERGQVMASGTHEELLRQNGTYKKLWEIQAGGFIP